MLPVEPTTATHDKRPRHGDDMTHATTETMTAKQAARTLNVSRRTINRYINSGDLVDAGTDPETYKRLLTLDSVVQLKDRLAESRQHGNPHARGDDARDDAGRRGDDTDPLGSSAVLLQLLREAQAQRDAKDAELVELRQTLTIAQVSSATLEEQRAAAAATAERLERRAEELKAEAEQQRAEADQLKADLQRLANAGPLERWRIRKGLRRADTNH